MCVMNKGLIDNGLVRPDDIIIRALGTSRKDIHAPIIRIDESTGRPDFP